MTMNITENISTRSDVHPLVHSNVTWTNIIANGFIIVNSYRVLSVVSVDIIVHAITIRYDTRCYFNVRSKADMNRLNLPHGDDN